ncbi:MAG: hypothetical protein KFF46_04585 [Desulfobacterales bacterium]|nr:hypothetical protein [Desulfobacterales bacterium]
MSNRRQVSGREMIQLVWGAALLLMGVAFFFRIPLIMEQVAEIDHFDSVRVFLHIAFYLMAVILAGGGIQKLYRFWQTQKDTDA